MAKNLLFYLFSQRISIGLRPSYPLSVIEIDNENKKLLIYDGTESDVPTKEENIQNKTVFETSKYYIEYTLVDHSVETFAYSFIETPRYGKFNPDYARDLGIPESNLWKKLQEGQIIDFNGQIIDPVEKGIVGPKRPGRKITYSGDLSPSESLIELGKDSDILIHEATSHPRASQNCLNSRSWALNE